MAGIRNAKSSVMGKKAIVAAIFGIFFSMAVPASPASAAVGPYLKSLYEKRPDLQALFNAKTFQVKPGADTLAIGLEDWARQYGWRKDEKLSFYKPKGRIPTLKKGSVPAPVGTALSYAVIDEATGLILAEKNANKKLSIASLTKLASVEVALSRGTPLSRVQAITAADQVGGSRLGVAAGTKFTVSDLIYAALLPSANDATNALADATRLTRKKFVELMNEKAKNLGFSRTSFVEPTGIDDGNVSTAREYAIFARSVFSRQLVRSYATTAKRTLKMLPGKGGFAVKNGNRLLTYPQYDDVYVFAGKTGYLGPEDGCNLAVGLKSPVGAPRPIVIVILGEDTMTQTMNDAYSLAKWAWTNYSW